VPLTELEVETAFAAHLAADGWMITTLNSDFTDLIAMRGEEVLIAEVKGHTKSAGAAIDIGYGQILRRMNSSGSPRRYALVVPDSLRFHASRVDAAVRERIGIEVFLVDESGNVESLQ